MGRPDVDALLDSLTPEQFDELWASERLDWLEARRTHRLLAVLAAEVHNAAVSIVAMLGLTKPDEDAYRTELDFLNPKKNARNRRARMSAEAAEAYAAQRYGGTRG